jgi:hypothetical protein
MVTEGFLSPEHRDMVAVDPDPRVLLDRFATYTPPSAGKWLPSTS